ncbi:MAG: hypothetical protein ChlgKO_13240 [Chlamydiales bacterium]
MLPIKIGSYRNGGAEYAFYEHCGGQTFAIDTDSQRPATVNCSRFSFPHNTPAVEKIALLLANSRVKATYYADRNEVIFCPETIIEWRGLKEKQLSGEVSFTFVCKDGRVCFGRGKYLVVWNYVDNETKYITIEENAEVTTAVETSLGEFLIGDDKGKIYREEEVFFEREGEVKQVVAFNDDVILALIGDVVYAIQVEGGVLITKMKVSDQAYVFSDGRVCWVEGDIFQMESFEEHYFEQRLGSTPFYNFIVLDEGHLFLQRECFDVDSKMLAVTLLNCHSGRFLEGRIKKETAKSILRRESVFLVGDRVIAFPVGKWSEHYEFHSFTNSEESYEGPQLGAWGVLAACKLSDGSIAYCTDTTTSGFHIISEEGEELFSGAIIKNRQAQFVRELPDGNIAIVFSSGAVQIVQPITRKRRLQELQEKGIVAIEKGNFYLARKIYEEVIGIAPRKTKVGEAFQRALEAPIDDPICARRARQLFRRIRSKSGVGLPNKKKYHKRLLVGEGGFLYTVALVEKHSDVAIHTEATEHLNHENDHAVSARVAHLRKKGVMVNFDVDATQIHKLYAGRRFERIQWNCPFGDPKFREKFYPVLPQFFRSAAQLQQPGDRVHIVLDQPHGYYKQRQIENPLIPAATLSKYRLIRKRRFDESRYPGYEHQITGQLVSYSDETCGREFVFEKTDLPQRSNKGFDASMSLLMKDYYKETPRSNKDRYATIVKQQTEELEVKKEKRYQVCKDNYSTVGASNVRFYYDCSTDEDSSDYYSSGSE